METKIVVRNMAQKVMLLQEMRGQISDGQWENAHPFDHWKLFADVQWDNVMVAEGDELCGTSFRAKRRYNFADSELLEVVGARMIAGVRFVLAHPQMATSLAVRGALIDGDTDMRSYFAWGNDPKNAWATRQVAAWREAGLTPELFAVAAAREDLYTWPQMLKDLRDLSRIVATQLQPVMA